MFLVARWAGRQTSGDSPPANFHLDTCRLSSTQCSKLSSLHLRGHLSFHNTAEAARDWGRIKRLAPAGVLYPESVDDIVSLVRTAGLSRNLTVAAKGRGHSINGQAQVALQSVCIVGRRQTENSLLSVRMRVNRVCTVFFFFVLASHGVISILWSVCRLWMESLSKCLHLAGSRWCQREMWIAQCPTWMQPEASFGLMCSKRHWRKVWLQGPGPTISISALAEPFPMPALVDKRFDTALKSATYCSLKLSQVHLQPVPSLNQNGFLSILGTPSLKFSDREMLRLSHVMF